jgi:hypothetical protein
MNPDEKSTRRGRQVLVAIAALLAGMFALGGVVSKTSPSEATSATTEDYVAALHVANSFLHAWLARSPEEGLRLISPRLHEPSPNSDAYSYDSWLRQYLAGFGDPHHQAFEIGPGRGRGSQFAFPVTLYEFTTGDAIAVAYTSTLEVIRVRDHWYVDRLPFSSDNPSSKGARGSPASDAH